MMRNIYLVINKDEDIKLIGNRYIKEIIVDVYSVGYKKNIEVFC